MVDPSPKQPANPPLLDTLTPPEVEVLAQLRQEYPNFDDYTLGRFMRARKGQLPKIREMFEAFLKWRQEFGTDEIHSFDFPELPEVQTFYVHGFHKTDRFGRPIYIERYGNLNLKELFKVTTPDRMIKYYVKSYESMLSEKFPACSAAAGFPVEQSLTILDLGGSSMKLMKKKVFNFIKLASFLSMTAGVMSSILPERSRILPSSSSMPGFSRPFGP